MNVRAFLPARVRDDRTRRRLFLLCLLVPTMLGLAHHVDHIVRGNHVGWPVTGEVNAFTYSLAMYPLIAASLALTYTDRADVGYWASFFAFSTGVMWYFHVSPWAVEPPQDVIGPYASPAVGYLAFAVLLALIGALLVGVGYATHVWASAE
jgi:hypothetical protein